MPNSVDKKFGEIVRKRRIEMGMTQEELGNKVGCSKFALCYYEKGTRGVTISQFFKFCKVLKLDPNTIQKKL